MQKKPRRASPLNSINRRHFLKSAGAAIILPTILPGRVLGRGGNPPPSVIRSGIKWIGTEGWVWVDRGGFDTSNPEWKKGRNLPEELRKVKLYESHNHVGNFLDCVKSRQPTITPAETAHHSAIPGHLGLISMLTGPEDPVERGARENH